MSTNRRDVLAGLGTMASLLASTSLRAVARPPAVRPNFVFIMADDLGYADLSCTGSSHIKTPAIDSLARDGVQLDQAYANAPICSPTRTALLTGCYQYRFPIGLEEPLGPGAPAGIGVPRDRPTLASVLRDRGYATKLIGKWHLGEPPKEGPLQHGYDEFFGVVEGAADYFRHKIVVGGKEVGMGLARGDTPVTVDGYATDLFGDEAVRTIEQAGENAGNRPFLISLHFTSPHWPWEGREDAALAQSLDSSFDYAGGSLAKYKEMVEAMDQNVAKVLAALERTGQADNTVVVFTSDNGGERFSQTWPYVGHKGELLEGGVRVPVVMRWPGRIAPGSTCDQTMMSMDYLPTFLTMAGGDVARAGRFDGVDLSAQLTGAAPSFARTLYWRYKANDQAAIRQGNWKYLRLGGKEHLFDLAADAHEQADHALDQPARLRALRLEWDAWNAQMLPYPLGSYSEDLRLHYPDRYAD
ncbi:sulfatase-like hydrolase/transferase [Novosphingobium sp. 1949]|uniref:Sulfatase-like hydrolase/transferase n=1 Tax=Novosphingobium organovorum TaxID=2930092 RepID=A0ABT0BH48_9SPHN|nr:sulfatase-like hydrolase/transferase [Novosphingobium organovorum]MCJ2184402.1 sulfatase-like hydrolase/transferase [Novosphingobium organovorum]